jgi:hypothetical protein
MSNNMSNENNIPPLQHRNYIAEINGIFRDKHTLSGSNELDNCLSSWGIWLVGELIQKQAIFCSSCGNFNFVDNLDKLSDRIVCNNPLQCLHHRITQN